MLCLSEQLFWVWAVYSHPEDAQEALEVQSQGAPGPLGHLVLSAHLQTGKLKSKVFSCSGPIPGHIESCGFFLIFFFQINF